MREVKFRAWIKNENRMETCVCVSPFHVSDCDRYYWKHDDVILEQYTGLKDKNGKEIYEGDILGGDCELVTFQGKRTGKFSEARHVVAWNNENSGFATRKIYDSRFPEFYTTREVFGILSITAKYYPIIGNIHDNPELLK